MAKPKQTSDKMATLASGVLRGAIKPNTAQVKSLAATALAQDQTKGKRGKR